MNKKPQRIKRKHSLNPQHVSEHVWYYEERSGLLLVIEKEVTGGLQATQLTIPWRKVLASVNRHNGKSAKP